MRKISNTNRLLSLVLSLCMVLSLMPLSSMTVFAAEDVKYLPYDYRNHMLHQYQPFSYRNYWSAISATFEAGIDNPEYTRIYFQGSDEDRTGYWYAGGFFGALPENDLSLGKFLLYNIERFSMTGGNVGHVIMRSPDSEALENTETDISGGYLGTLEVITGSDDRSYTIDTDVSITVKDAALGVIYGGKDYDGNFTRKPFTVNGDINIDIVNATVGTIYDTSFKGGTHNGNTYIRVLDSNVGNIYVNPNNTGEHSGYINSGKLNNTDCFTNLVYLDGTSWMVKGDMDTALNGKDLVIGEGQTLTLSNQTSDAKIVNYGTLTVKDGGILNWVVNHGTMILEDGSRITELDNHGTLTSTGTMYVQNMDNHGTVNFTGTAHSMTHVNNRPNGVFNCHGDHDNMSFYQDLGVFYCDSTDCETIISGYYYGVKNLEWNTFYVNVTNEQGVPCNMQEYSCTLVPQWDGMLLAETITVREFRNFTQTLEEGVHYSYNRETGEFKLFKGTVTYYDLSVTAEAYFPTNIYEMEVTLDQDRFLWDGTAKEPQVVSVKDGDTVLQEGRDYRVVEYRSNVDPGTGYVVLQGMGEYSGTVSIPFEIYQKDLANGYYLTVEEGTWTFINGEIKPKVESVYVRVDNDGDGIAETVTLEEGKDYTVSYENNIKPGTATVKVTGIGQYKGTLTENFTINKAGIKDVTIVGNQAPFTGEQQSLNILVTYNGMTLTEGVDYTLRYVTANPLKLQYVGDTTEVTIWGIGDCFEYSDQFQWSIVAADLSDFSFVGIDTDGEELYYTGYPQTPPSDWYVLVENASGQKLYIRGQWTPVTNVSDTSIFTAVSGSSMTGSVEVPGIINPTHIGSSDVYADDTAQGRIYTGKTQTVDLTVLLFDNGGQYYDLVEGVNYTVSGTTEAKEPGKYTLTLTAKSENFTGSRTVTWKISPVDISKAEITMDAVPAFVYNGMPQTPETGIFYTYPDGTRVEVPGAWTSVTNAGDDATFTAASGYFTGSVTLKDVVRPLDITGLLELPESGMYHASEQEPSPNVGSFGNFTYTKIWDRTPIDVGTYTATITGTGNFTGTVVCSYQVTPRPLSVTVRLENKIYDGTTDVNVREVMLEGAMPGDDVALDHSNLVVTLSGAAADTYPTAQVSGLTLSGETLKNYTYDLSTVALQGEYGGDFSIAPRDVLIVAEEQDLTEGEELDPTRWYVDEAFLLPDGYTLSGVVLTATEDNEIVPSGGIITNADGEDVTENFNLRYYSSRLELICTNHVCDDMGFCPNCDGYEMPEVDPGEDPEWDYDDIYLVYNAGQLFWVADYVNNIKNEINVKLMADITVPEGKEWTPIMNFYGTFDGNYKTVSGLYVKSEGNEVGFFGGGSYSYGTVRNLNLSNSYFEGADYVGGLAGYFGGTIENCSVDGTVTVVGNDSGTLVGDLGGYLFNSYAYAPVPVGYYNESYGTIENCYYLSETDDGNGGKTAEQFASGEVAYLLQSAIQGEEVYDEETDSYITLEPKQIWGQSIGEDAYPVLGGEAVYQLQDCSEGTVSYSNAYQPARHVFDAVTGECTCGLQTQASASVTVGDTTTDFRLLGDAIQAVKDCTVEDQATVKLLVNIDLGESGQTISSGEFTLDLNGCELIGSGVVLTINGTNVTITDSGVGGKIVAGSIGVCIYERGTVTVAGGTILAGARGLDGERSTMIIAGGTISGGDLDMHSVISNIILTVEAGKTEGATFPGGITIDGVSLEYVLADGAVYWQNGQTVLPGTGVKEITGGDVVIKTGCYHNWVDATCTTPKTCTVCGETDGDALGHSYENNVCTVCGQENVSVKLDSASLSFKEKIHYNIFFSLGIDETVDLSDMGLIMFDSLNADGTMDDAIAIYSGAVEMDGKYMVATDGVPAKCMGDTIYFRAYAKLADGSYVYSKTVQYSAVTYAERILAGDEPENAKALVVAMLNYGAAAQMLFGYNTDNLVNAFLTEEQKALSAQYGDDMVSTVPVVAAEKQGIFSNNQGFSQRVPAVSFEGAFEINYFFTPAYTPVDGITLYYWTEADFEANEVLTVDNATGSLKLEGTGTQQYRGSIGGIAAKDLSENIYVAAVYSDGTDTWTSGVLGYSIGAYCGRLATRGDAMAELVMATAVYGYHAKQYFGS